MTSQKSENWTYTSILCTREHFEPSLIIIHIQCIMYIMLNCSYNVVPRRTPISILDLATLQSRGSCHIEHLSGGRRRGEKDEAIKTHSIRLRMFCIHVQCMYVHEVVYIIITSVSTTKLSISLSPLVSSRVDSLLVSLRAYKEKRACNSP